VKICPRGSTLAHRDSLRRPSADRRREGHATSSSAHASGELLMGQRRPRRSRGDRSPPRRRGRSRARRALPRVPGSDRVRRPRRGPGSSSAMRPLPPREPR
jgi:hypothetical protein